MSNPEFFARPSHAPPAPERLSDFARAVLEGLCAPAKRLPCKFFYDARGSVLFDEICALPEYYPTRTEIALFRDHAPEMARTMGREIALIEFGAGALTKVELLLDALERPRAYVPIDISGDYLRAMAAKLEKARPGLNVLPLVADFTKPLALPQCLSEARRVGFFPGSTIGNMDGAEALAFLRKAAAVLKGGGMLIGVDLVKDPRVLHAAYNDAAGVTAAFNKNLLVRANRELDAGFDLDAFAHYAFYNPHEQRIEMHLMSLKDQHVRVLGRGFYFVQGETVHTENSYKYTVEGFRRLARQAGFAPRQVWSDAQGLFSLHWLEC
ncbi:MAG: L-histidine N(alpha)-methyltransferase [Alphaproteobacteria bacterium]|nr:L-histidine N(alpha)-methyltransferase [Alphaproteobacteria bacterium]